jgi:ligand-binding sensor domain-containing protein
MRLAKVAALPVWLCAALHAERLLFDPEYVITAWGTEDGLPESSATSMVQTADGFLLFGTFGGLVRYDGHRFQVVTPDLTPQLPNTGVVKLYQDPAGAVWVSMLSGVAILNKDQWQTVNALGGSSREIVMFLAAGRDKSMHLLTSSHKVLYRKADRWEELPPPPLASSRMAFVSNDEGEVCVAADDSVVKWTGSAWQLVARVKDLAGESIGAWIRSRDGAWLAVGRDSVYRIRGDRVLARIRANAPLQNVVAVYEDEQQTLWLTSYTDGLYRIDKDGRLRQFNRKTGFVSNSIRFAMQDRWGNLWVGTNGNGLVRLRRRQFQSWGEDAGLPDVPVKSVAPRPDGGLWVATYGEGVYRLNGDRAVPAFPGTPMGRFSQALLVDRAGRLWIGSYQDGLWMSDGGLPRRIEQSGSSTIEALYEDKQGRIWVGSSENVAVYEDGRLRTIELLEKKNPVAVAAFAEDGDVLWAGGDGGLYRLTDGRFLPVKDLNGRELPAVRAITSGARGELWLGTLAEGLLRFRNGVVTPTPNPHGTRAGVGAIERHGDWMWLSTTQGVWRVRERDLARASSGINWGSWRLFGKEDGIANVETSVGHQPMTARDDRGRLWIATVRGVISASMSESREDTSPAAVVIEEISYRDAKAAEVRVPWRGAEVRLPPGSLDVKVAFTTTHQGAPERVLFAYELTSAGGSAVGGPTPRRELQFFRLGLHENRLHPRVERRRRMGAGGRAQALSGASDLAGTVGPGARRHGPGGGGSPRRLSLGGRTQPPPRARIAADPAGRGGAGETAGAARTGTEDGVGRAAGGRRGARFQQSPDRHQWL